MALKQSREVPKDAVALDEIEATNYVWEVVTNWESLSDTWALRYAPMVLGGVSALSGIIINDHYRKKLKLGNFGFFSSVIPISVMPGLMTALFHRHIISTNMLLMKNEGCPVCYEIRSAVIQWGFGVAYPMVLGPTSALMFANRYSTYRVPNLAEGPKVVFGFLSKLTKPLHTTLVYMGVFQLVLSSVLTYFEMKNHISLSRKIEAIEAKVLAEHGSNKKYGWNSSNHKVKPKTPCASVYRQLHAHLQPNHAKQTIRGHAHAHGFTRLHFGVRQVPSLLFI